MYVLDSGAVTRFARDVRGPSRARAAAIEGALTRMVVPVPVLVECLTGSSTRDANVNAFLKRCRVVTDIPVGVARRAALLRTRARRGSAVDALVVALAEPGGLVFTGDVGDLTALAAYAEDVSVEAI